jgi:hypothetical protein
MSSQFRDLIGQDDAIGNDGDAPGYSTPFSTSEIDELLYNEEWPAEQRIARLMEMRAQLVALEASDFGDDDPRSLVRQIDAAIARFEATDLSDTSGLELDMGAHRETLAPDSDELLDLQAADEASLTNDDGEDGPVDEREWIAPDGR